MKSLTETLRALSYVHNLREQVNIVALSKVPLRVRRTFYVVDSLLFSLPFILIGVAAHSWPLILLMSGITAVLSLSYWYRIETNIPAVIEQAKMMRGEAHDS